MRYAASMIRPSVLATLSAALLAAATMLSVPAHAAGPTPAPSGMTPERYAAIHNTTFKPGSMIVDPDGNMVPVGARTAGTSVAKRKMPTPGRKAGASTLAACSPTCYFYSGAYATFASPYKQGVRTEATVQKPAMDSTDWSGGGHTLAELTAQDGSGNVVEIGWNIDAIVNGDGWTHLFVAAWKTGTFLGYNAAGGFVDNGAVSTNAGTNINSAVGTSQRLAIQYITSACGCTPGWWVAYGSPTSQWIGIFPDSSIWNAAPATSFTVATSSQGFGELAAAHAPSCTDIGNGTLAAATGTYPAGGAQMNTFATEVTSGGAYTTTAWTGLTISDAARWNAVLTSGSTNSIRYGGPGFAPDPAACP